MKIDINGAEAFSLNVDMLWAALNDPIALGRCIPGCEQMQASGDNTYVVQMHLKVAAVSGSFEGLIELSEQEPPRRCVLVVEGAGSLGSASGRASFMLEEGADGATTLDYEGQAEIEGLVVGVGQRILKSVSKHLIKQFFQELRAAAGPGN